MPIYEYRCESCGREFEEWQKFSDAPVERCSDCGGPTRRLISQSTFVLKGSGWYVTDYGRNSSCSSSRKAPAKKESTTETKSTDSASSTSSADS
jgi:putative FmdB family regulatory protein